MCCVVDCDVKMLFVVVFHFGVGVGVVFCDSCSDYTCFCTELLLLRFSDVFWRSFLCVFSSVTIISPLLFILRFFVQEYYTCHLSVLRGFGVWVLPLLLFFKSIY